MRCIVEIADKRLPTLIFLRELWDKDCQEYNTGGRKADAINRVHGSRSGVHGSRQGYTASTAGTAAQKAGYKAQEKSTGPLILMRNRMSGQTAETMIIQNCLRKNRQV